MFKDVYDKRGLAPNLSRTLEMWDSYLRTYPMEYLWCLPELRRVSGHYFMYAFFNLISPVMTLIYAWFGIKIRKK